ncbi:MAG: alanine/ornithine racemase family PLP-dependent enzyme [Chitinophagaceae bacterium]|nr:alanine/ornithine racemase family PLP-dependent enzyme [Chitinophagaceae bacterium]
MAFLKLYKNRLKHNYNFLSNLFKKNNTEWGVVTKLLCGNKLFLQELINLGIAEMHDTRISNLKAIKELSGNIQTVYIKPPPKRSIPKLIKYADVSFNTDLSVIKLLSEESVRQNKTHKIIIMVEMGDLREGVMGEDLLDFYGRVFELPNINIVGIGTNLNCLNGIMPSPDKMIQLALYKQLIEVKFNHKIPWVSGGTTVAIPMLIKHQIPKSINHFRIGEALYFGKDIFTDGIIKGMRSDIFQLFTEIIELIEKPMTPTGEQMENPSGIKTEFDIADIGKTSHRAIIDIGLLECNPQFLIPDDDAVKIIEASSDMLVLDLGRNSGKYKVGDLVSFQLKYMGALGIMNSNYIQKVVE